MFEDQDWDLDRVDLDQRAINQQDSRTETKIYLQRTEMTLQTTTTVQKERPSGTEQLVASVNPWKSTEQYKALFTVPSTLKHKNWYLLIWDQYSLSSNITKERFYEF